MNGTSQRPLQPVTVFDMTAQDMRGVIWRGAAPLVLLGLAIAGCSNEDAGHALPGQTFLASGEGLADAPDGLASARDVELVIHRDADGLVATADCNHIGGPLEVKDDVLVVEMTETTEQACSEAEAAQDEALTSFMESRPTWQLEGETLTLATDTARIEFERQPSNGSD